MNSLVSFFGQRRKAIGYTFSAAAELVAQAVPQTNPQNAMVLHAIIAVLGFICVYFPANDTPASPADLIDGLLAGDTAAAKHAAAPAAPASLADPVPLG